MSSVAQGGCGQQIGSAPFGRASIASEWWAPPAAPGQYDSEFDSSIIPSAYTLFNIQAPPPAVIVTPITGVDLWSQPAAGNVRIQSNMNAKRSWLCMQPRAENVRWFYARKVTLSGNNGWVFRTRILTHLLQGGGSNNSSVIRLVVAKDDGTGTKPALIAAGNGMTDALSWGWESDPNTMQLELAVVKNSITTSIWSSLDKDDANNPYDGEIIALLRSGAATQTWEFYVRSSMITWLVAVTDSALIGLKQGDTVWVGWDFVGLDAIPVASGRSPILCADYLRVEETNANFLP